VERRFLGAAKTTQQGSCASFMEKEISKQKGKNYPMDWKGQIAELGWRRKKRERL